jgi:hypothetical protein
VCLFAEAKHIDLLESSEKPSDAEPYFFIIGSVFVFLSKKNIAKKAMCA